MTSVPSEEALLAAVTKTVKVITNMSDLVINVKKIWTNANNTGMEYVVVLRELNSVNAFKRLNDSISRKAFSLSMSKTLGFPVTVQGPYLPKSNLRASTNLKAKILTVESGGAAGGTSTGQQSFYLYGDDSGSENKLSPKGEIIFGNFISSTESLPLCLINFARLHFILHNFTLFHFTILYFTITILLLYKYYATIYYLIHSTILYYTLLYFTLLYFTLLYFTLLYFTLLYFTLLYFTLLCFNFILFYSI